MRHTLIALTAAVALSQPPPAEGAKPATAASSAPSTATFANRADAMLRNLTAADRFSGAVLVAKDGKVVFRKAYGLANREWNVPVTPDTEFRLGSITKQFTAAAILQLAEQGKLSVDDPISKYYDAPAAWSGVTLKHLLTHSSGIPSFTAIPGFFASPNARADLSPERIVALTRDKPLEFQPGSRFNYDNTGYILLGMVVEKVSGQTYAAYLQDHILTPLGLAHTGYDRSEALIPHRAAGYDRSNDGPVTNAAFLSMTLPYAAGALYSNVDDLLAWDVALRRGKVISPASLTAMFTNHGFQYGYGQQIETLDGLPYPNHGGTINGFQTMLARAPDVGLVVIVLTNLNIADPRHVSDQLIRMYRGADFAAGPTGAPTAAELDAYVGRYKMTSALTLDVTRDGNRLYSQMTGQPKTELTRELGRSFFGERPAAGYMQFAPGAKAPTVIARRGRAEVIFRRE